MARCSQLLGSKNNSATFRATAKSYASLAAEQGFPAIVFIDAPAALSPIVELAGPYTQPVDESPGADLGFFSDQHRTKSTTRSRTSCGRRTLRTPLAAVHVPRTDRKPALYPTSAALEWQPSLPRHSAFALFSYVFSVILTEERSLQFLLRQDIWQIILTFNDSQNHFRHGSGWLLKAAR